MYTCTFFVPSFAKRQLAVKGSQKNVHILRARGANAVPQASFWPDDSGIAARSRPSRRRFDRLRTHSGSALGVTLA